MYYIYFPRNSAVYLHFSAKNNSGKYTYKNQVLINLISSSSSIIITWSNIFLSQFLQVKPNFYFDGLLWRSFMLVCDMTIVFFSIETVKCSWSDSQSSSCDHVHVFMYWYRGWKHSERHTLQVCAVNKIASAEFIHTETHRTCRIHV